MLHRPVEPAVDFVKSDEQGRGIAGGAAFAAAQLLDRESRWGRWLRTRRLFESFLLGAVHSYWELEIKDLRT